MMFKTDFTRIFLLCLVMAAGLSVSPVQAKKETMQDSDYVDIITTPTFYVKSNGTKYTELSKQKHPLMAWQIAAQFSYGAPGNDLIKSYHLQLRLAWVAGSKTENFNGSHVSKSYALGKRPEYINTNVIFPLGDSKFESFLVNACNARADGLRNLNGMNNNQLFGQDHQVEAKIFASHAIDIQKVPGSGFESAQAKFPDRYVKIICMKKPTPTVDTPDTLSMASGVTDASLNIIKQSTLGGSCKVNLSTVIKTNLPNTTVKFRFEHNNGNKSDIKTVTTSHTKTAMHAYWYDVPNDPNHAETGKIRIIGVSHDFQTAWKSYHMTCNTAGPSGLSVVTKPTVKLDIVPMNNITYRGLICPSKVRIIATLSSSKAFSGTGVVTVKDSSYSFGSHDVNLSPNKPWKYDETFNLKSWNTVNASTGIAGGSNTLQNQPGSNASTPFQRFQIRYNLTANQNLVVRTPYKTVSVRCKKPTINPNLPGSDSIVGSQHKQTEKDSVRALIKLQDKTPLQNAMAKQHGAHTTLYTGKLGARCKRSHFPKHAVIKQTGRQLVVECIQGKVEIKPGKPVLNPWKKGDPVISDSRGVQ